MNDKSKVSVMLDKHFTVGQMLKEINVDLNIPPFLNEKQVIPSYVQRGMRIVSLRIHVERAIGRLKNFYVLR